MISWLVRYDDAYWLDQGLGYTCATLTMTSLYHCGNVCQTPIYATKNIPLWDVFKRVRKRYDVPYGP
jgi:hypothetical protein